LFPSIRRVRSSRNSSVIFKGDSLTNSANGACGLQLRHDSTGIRPVTIVSECPSSRRRSIDCVQFPRPHRRRSSSRTEAAPASRIFCPPARTGRAPTRALTIPTITDLVTLANVWALLAHLPKETRTQSAALQMVLMLEGLEYRLKEQTLRRCKDERHEDRNYSTSRSAGQADALH
jgi:hypothetical protein